MVDDTLNSENYRVATGLVSTALEEEGLKLSKKQHYQAVSMVYDLLSKGKNLKPSSYLVKNIIKIVKRQVSRQIH